MALRSGYTKRSEIPHEAGEWMDLRLLGWHELGQAQRARQGESFENIKLMGKDLYKTMQEVRTELGSAVDTAGDPLQQYDLGTVLKLGIVGWSYDAPVNDETVKQLDTQTAEWAARIIVGVVAETEAERKNGSEPSISH